jgi:putative SOS response-associated peptidase YedK
MCNHYSMTRNQEATRRLFKISKGSAGNLPTFLAIFPDTEAPVIRQAGDGCELRTMRWGMPTSQEVQLRAAKNRAARLHARSNAVDFKELLRMEPDVRNTSSKHWRRWLGPEDRAPVSLAEFDEATKEYVWFAADESRPLLGFARIWTNWTSVRKIKEGEVTIRRVRVSDYERQQRRQTSALPGDTRHPDHRRRTRHVDARAVG